MMTRIRHIYRKKKNDHSNTPNIAFNGLINDYVSIIVYNYNADGHYHYDDSEFLPK